MDSLETVAAADGVERLDAGKVRERFSVPGDHLLLVATDRISAFDVVLPTPITDRGKVLSAMTVFWLRGPLADEPHHLVSSDPAEFPEPLARHAEVLSGRAMLVRHADMIPVECVARGFLAGSGWADYQATGRVGGVKLPDGLSIGEQLPEPIFSPATKAASGHDENITFDDVARTCGGDLAEQLREVTLRVYRRAADHAAERGLILADTKFELGFIDGELSLCDEVVTCDSSRFWPAENHTPGEAPDSYDKQIVRDWLASSDWDRTPPAPALPDEVVTRTRARYIEVYERLVERPFLEWTGG